MSVTQDRVCEARDAEEVLELLIDLGALFFVESCLECFKDILPDQILGCAVSDEVGRGCLQCLALRSTR